MVIIYTVSIIYIVYIVYTVCIIKYTVCYKLIIKYVVYRSLLQTCCKICGLLQFASECGKFIAKCAVYTNC
jgi:hypothetical protein